jgi:hypothetical protein
MCYYSVGSAYYFHKHFNDEYFKLFIANKHYNLKKIIGGTIMKTKDVSKKLVLTKDTICNLNQEDLNEVKGGIPTTMQSVQLSCVKTFCGLTTIYCC